MMIRFLVDCLCWLTTLALVAFFTEGPVLKSTLFLVMLAAAVLYFIAVAVTVARRFWARRSFSQLDTTDIPF